MSLRPEATINHISADRQYLVVESCAITRDVDLGRLLQQLPPATMIGFAATGKREDLFETWTLRNLWNDSVITLNNNMSEDLTEKMYVQRVVQEKIALLLSGPRAAESPPE